MDITVTAALSAAAVASSTALILIPSVETLTLFAFFMGIVLTKKHAVIGVITSTLLFEFAASATYGPSGLVFPLKLLAWLIVLGFGIMSRTLIIRVASSDRELGSSKMDRVLLYGLGATSAFVFDAITNVGMLLFLPSSSESLIVLYLAVFVAGLPFTVVHVFSTSLLFLVLPEMTKLFFEKTKHLNLSQSRTHDAQVSRVETPTATTTDPSMAVP